MFYISYFKIQLLKDVYVIFKQFSHMLVVFCKTTLQFMSGVFVLYNIMKIDTGGGFSIQIYII